MPSLRRSLQFQSPQSSSVERLRCRRTTQEADTARVKEGQVCPLPSWHSGHARAHLGQHLGQLLHLPPGKWAGMDEWEPHPHSPVCFPGWKPGVGVAGEGEKEPVTAAVLLGFSLLSIWGAWKWETDSFRNHPLAPISGFRLALTSSSYLLSSLPSCFCLFVFPHGLLPGNKGGSNVHLIY